MGLARASPFLIDMQRNSKTKPDPPSAHRSCLRRGIADRTHDDSNRWMFPRTPSPHSTLVQGLPHERTPSTSRAPIRHADHGISRPTSSPGAFHQPGAHRIDASSPHRPGWRAGNTPTATEFPLANRPFRKRSRTGSPFGIIGGYGRPRNSPFSRAHLVDWSDGSTYLPRSRPPVPHRRHGAQAVPAGRADHRITAPPERGPGQRRGDMMRPGFPLAPVRSV